jgi:hypothetical protein
MQKEEERPSIIAFVEGGEIKVGDPAKDKR